MLKIRLKKGGRKKQAVYRIVLMNSHVKRDGLVIEELGLYDPIRKNITINKEKALVRLKQGAKPTKTVQYLLDKENISL